MAEDQNSLQTIGIQNNNLDCSTMTEMNEILLSDQQGLHFSETVSTSYELNSHVDDNDKGTNTSIKSMTSSESAANGDARGALSTPYTVSNSVFAPSNVEQKSLITNELHNSPLIEQVEEKGSDYNVQNDVCKPIEQDSVRIGGQNLDQASHSSVNISADCESSVKVSKPLKLVIPISKPASSAEANGGMVSGKNCSSGSKGSSPSSATFSDTSPIPGSDKKRRRIQHDYRRLSSSGYVDDYENGKDNRFTSPTEADILPISPGRNKNVSPQTKPASLDLHANSKLISTSLAGENCNNGEYMCRFQFLQFIALAYLTPIHFCP